jgi:HK97 family phage major capsid protein
MRKKAIVRQYMQYRAEDLKSLTEQRAELVQQMKDLTSSAETEKRAFSPEEDQKFDDLDKQVKALDSTIEKLERARDLKLNVTSTAKNEELKQEELEERAFAAYIRGEVLEERAGEMTKTDNGAVIPKTIANRIIKKVEDICPIYRLATRYNIKGTLSIPYYAADGNTITMAYADEFKSLTSTSGKFTNIELTGYLAGALSKVSKSLANNSQFDIVSFVVTAMSESISRFIEMELLHGTTAKVDGLKGVTLSTTAAAANKITMDELIMLKDTVKDAFQAKGVFIMNSATRTALRLLKDSNGRYLMQDDITSAFGTTLLGKPVYVSDQMDGMEAGKTAIYYGDFSGLAVKLSEDASVQVLQERYADEHAIGVIAWMEFDAKVENAQKIAKLVMKASA